MTTVAEPDPRLTVSGLSVTFGGLTALDDVSFDVAAGQVVALIGPNGAGKTTVFNAVCGLVRSRGRIAIDGRPAPARTSDLTGRGVARTLQGLGLFDGATVRENVAVPVSGSRDHRDAATRVAAQLAAHDLTTVADRPVAALPYPLRKRVALARALVTEPRLLLLDEPAGGLGHDDIDALGHTVRAVADAGCAVLLVEHHVDFVMSVADQVVVLDFGRVIARGAPDDVRNDPAVEEAYLGIKATA
ncbi:ABC transporter ATP-binding protein [Microbacterium sp. zg.Y1090]|uniref:ABC transporter ATP-binding protein n=1 Tax=Microbacterium TaxID=33882 RepID=UPI00214B91F8|nr:MULTISPECIES: ABC transporter ATP-binding protein [unclassified Microbacterium]MCR2813172.1 ABC transporter ATP-binding protein [Microbacterium sp. zg.Y1084]MCR2819485.1 ABC transporter ATP-binding protein [Microbacterium sp. zg.Y1090]MDL5487339.1 ABC transporter ATP-binding protein [Microbacterium sp. zg-Y1211]WIM28458.1 ABC transporter ATP-binding protein [Microbacterium sp. zg-Y1090]